MSEDPWFQIRPLTSARIGLARSGASLSTAPLLAMRLAHARARDAVHATLDEAALLETCGPATVVNSAARDRGEYLLRPDLGRQLAPGTVLERGDYDLVLVVADGLSAFAVQRQAGPVLAALRPLLAGWRLAPLMAVRQGRVAVGDALAQATGSAAAAVLIGERPGLSAPDSLGAYLTWRPGPGTTDAQRNCVSNIRPGGVDPREAAKRMAWLLQAMRETGRSGVALKDESSGLVAIAQQQSG